MNNSHNLTPPYDSYSLSELREEVKNRGLITSLKSSDRSEHAHLVTMLTGNDVFTSAVQQALGLSPQDLKKSLEKFSSDS